MRGPKVGGRYDQFVKVMRVALPAASVVLLLAIVVWPLVSGQEMSFVLSKDRVEVSPERLRMEAPRYRGTDSQGRPFEISAARAVQQTSATPVVELSDVAARMAMANDTVQVNAERGSYDLEQEQLKVTGPLVLTTERGYHLTTRDAVVDLPGKVAYGSAGVEGNGPLGTFKAQRFRADIEKETVVFEGRTHMRITPRS
ncbi:MAG TPA: LPS export ABC transporter periplasmic protein LptC [Pedomonas sp.]|uniref:LPS export ABC transporter periplasmic protein LptC n=1 Tax=Pedomonas sp. TaxID=2976421 RepID=UPI002F40053F